MSSLEQAIQIPVITDRKCGTPEKGTQPAILRMAGGAFLLPAVSRQNMTDEKMSTKDIHEMQDPRDEFRQEGMKNSSRKLPGSSPKWNPCRTPENKAIMAAASSVDGRPWSRGEIQA